MVDGRTRVPTWKNKRKVVLLVHIDIDIKVVHMDKLKGTFDIADDVSDSVLILLCVKGFHLSNTAEQKERQRYSLISS